MENAALNLFCPRAQLNQAKSALNKVLAIAHHLSQADPNKREPTPELTNHDQRVSLCLTKGNAVSSEKRKKKVGLSEEESKRRKAAQRRKKGQAHAGDGGAAEVEQEEEEEGGQGAQAPIPSVQTDPLLGKVREPLTDAEMAALCVW